MTCTRKDVQSVTDAAFPEYRGRKFKIEARTTLTLSGVHWDGGSRSEFRAVRLTDNGVASLDTSAAPWNCKVEGSRVEIPEGVAIVEHSIFCGKDMGLRVYVHPANMQKFLQA
jgi:hypothetical protein